MAAKFKNGALVVQIVKPVRGAVIGFDFNRGSGEITPLIGFKDADGEHAIHLPEEQLQTQEEAAAEAAAWLESLGYAVTAPKA